MCIDYICIERNSFLANLVIYLLLVAITIAVLLLVFRFRKLSIGLLAKIDEYVISFTVAYWLFNMFYLHIALVLWIIVYIVLTAINSKSRLIINYEREYNQKACANTRYDKKIYDSIIEKVCVSKNNKIIISIYEKRNTIIKMLKNQNKHLHMNIKERCRFFESYVKGIIVFAANYLLHGEQYVDNRFRLLIVLENSVGMFGMMIFLYPMVHFIFVDNLITSSSGLYKNQKLFKIIYTFSMIIALLVVIKIALI